MSRRQFLLVLLLLTAIVGSGAALWHLALRRATEALSVVRPKETTVDLDAVVTRIHDLNRLETASMHVIHVSTLSQSYQLVPDTFGGDSITFFAAGDVIAGVDLSQLKPSDVSRQADGSIVVRLPASQILVTRLDNRESRILGRRTGMLRHPDVDLETRARQHAEIGIRQEALRKGVLVLARQNAEKSIADLLHTLGFAHVVFDENGTQHKAG